jgi:hypothetical protein
MAALKNTNPIFLKEKVEVVSTDKDPHHKTGAKFSVHPVVAEKLYANGLATKVGAAVESKPSKKEKE